LGIPPFSFSDGPRGATVGGHKNTIFPVAMARGASWDRKLEASVADVIGKEIRANGGNYTGTPCINLLTHVTQKKRFFKKTMFYSKTKGMMC
jgi:beta-glucosidase